MKNHAIENQILKLFSRNFLRKSQVLVLLFLLVVSACQNTQEQDTKEVKQTITKSDKEIALANFMKENDIGSLFVSQEQRQIAKQNLDFVAKFLAPFLQDEQFIQLFIDESKSNLAKGGMPGLLVSDFLQVYETKTGRSLLSPRSSSSYRLDNKETEKFLELLKGFPLTTNKETIFIKPQMYMARLDNRFFNSYEKPKGIFASHFMETNENVSLYGSENGGQINVKSTLKKDLFFSSNIFVGGFYTEESRFFLFKKDGGGVIVMMNSGCNCYSSPPGPICQNGHCVPGYNGPGCGYTVETVDGVECSPYCCQIQ